ncbi:MAG: non-canonical purine NTP pyrophosphatase [Clostridia bacterium]|nr:non-canonical purine NTP pyrophosphatase [Clostridia bacterium]
MTILIGTTNPSKVGYFENLLEGCGVSFITLGDLGVSDEPQETGSTPEENARIKAEFYGRYADAVICADSGLYFDSLPLTDPRQPGLHVRTPQGVRLDDAQMVEYYKALSHSLGGHVLSYYVDGCALKIGNRVYGFQETREEALANAFYLVDRACEEMREGWPLDSISLDLDEVSFHDPRRETLIQNQLSYKERLRAFLIEKLEENR